MGASCGFAYVHFGQEANAKTAMATLHIANFHGKKIVVKQFKSKKQRLEEQKRQVDVTNIRNLSRNTSNELYMSAT